jgi:hypothetical protein
MMTMCLPEVLNLRMRFLKVFGRSSIGDSVRIGRSNSSFGHLKCFGCAISESVCTKLLHRSRFTLHLNRKVHIFSTLHQKKEVMCKPILDLPKEFAGRRTLVTGGSRGIGAATAQRQSQEHKWTFIGAEVV